MKPTEYNKYVLVEFISFPKTPGYIEGFLLMLLIQVHINNSGETKKDLMLKWRLFVIHKLMIICMIWLYVHK